MFYNGFDVSDTTGRVTWESCGHAIFEKPTLAGAAISRPSSAPISKPEPVLIMLFAVNSHELEPGENLNTAANKSHDPQENIAPDPTQARLNGNQRGRRPR
jgi:hypothetical protein